jgi:hypothetical protein
MSTVQELVTDGTYARKLLQYTYCYDQFGRRYYCRRQTYRGRTAGIVIGAIVAGLFLLFALYFLLLAMRRRKAMAAYQAQHGGNYNVGGAATYYPQTSYPQGAPPQGYPAGYPAAGTGGYPAGYPPSGNTTSGNAPAKPYETSQNYQNNNNPYGSYGNQAAPAQGIPRSAPGEPAAGIPVPPTVWGHMRQDFGRLTSFGRSNNNGAGNNGSSNTAGTVTGASAAPAGTTATANQVEMANNPAQIRATQL